MEIVEPDRATRFLVLAETVVFVGYGSNASQGGVRACGAAIPLQRFKIRKYVLRRGPKAGS